jgi:hypothetical protein
VRAINDGLAGQLSLTRELEDRRIRKTEQLTKRLVYHAYLITRWRTWTRISGGGLRKPRVVGDGAHTG